MTFKPLAHASAFLKVSAFAGVAILSMATPSKSAVVGCAKGDQASSFLLSDITSGALTGCYSDDKFYSNFAGFTGFNPGTQFSIQSGIGGVAHTIAVQSALGLPFTPGNYNFTYDVMVWEGPNLITGYATGATTSDPDAKWSKFLQGPGSPIIATTVSPIATSGLSMIVPGVKSASFTTDLVVTEGEVTQFVDGVRQTQTSPVPGPLPLLGAAAAFGYSRLIRARIKSTNNQIAC